MKSGKVLGVVLLLLMSKTVFANYDYVPWPTFQSWCYEWYEYYSSESNESSDSNNDSSSSNEGNDSDAGDGGNF